MQHIYRADEWGGWGRGWRQTSLRPSCTIKRLPRSMQSARGGGVEPTNAELSARVSLLHHRCCRKKGVSNSVKSSFRRDVGLGGGSNCTLERITSRRAPLPNSYVNVLRCCRHNGREGNKGKKKRTKKEKQCPSLS